MNVYCLFWNWITHYRPLFGAELSEHTDRMWIPLWFACMWFDLGFMFCPRGSLFVKTQFTSFSLSCDYWTEFPTHDFVLYNSAIWVMLPLHDVIFLMVLLKNNNTMKKWICAKPLTTHTFFHCFHYKTWPSNWMHFFLRAVEWCV